MTKLIVSDVDGTLVPDSASTINPEYYEVIRALSAKGIQVVIASGRQYASIRRLFEPVQDLLWFIAEGGSMIMHGDDRILLKPIPDEWVAEFLQDLSTLPDVDCMLAAPDLSYTPFADTQMFRWMRESYRFDICAMGGWDKMPPEGICKMAVYHPTDVDGVCSEWLIPKWKERMYVASSGVCWIDFLMPGVDKGAALGRIRQELGIAKEQTIAFGDNNNDIELLRAAGTGVAVSSAREPLKQIADRIVPNFEQDGVLQVWKEILALAE
ncbi:MAG: HAD family hydrolase [Butyricicoccaceae bacterium]